MAKKQFKAESKRLLELMINSIYTNRLQDSISEHLLEVDRQPENGKKLF